MTWLRLICSEPDTWRRALGRSLSKAGVYITEPAGDRALPRDHLFDDPGAEVVAAVREVSHGGVGRVLALAAAGAAVGAGFAWQLLRAGASDVFAWDDVRTKEAGAQGGGRR